MPEHKLTDFTGTAIETESPAFDTKSDSCPFCGHTVHEPYLEGVNCAVCLHCAEGLNFYTPFCVDVHGETGFFRIWSYIPIAENWDRDADAVFLESEPNTISYDELTSTEQAIVRCVGRSTDLSQVSELTNVPKGDRDTIQAITDHIPRPTVFSGGSIYTVNSDQLEALLSRTVEATTQASLDAVTGDAVSNGGTQ